MLYDENYPRLSLPEICALREEFPVPRTARYWLKQRRDLGAEVAERKTSRAGKTRRGRPSKDVTDTLDSLDKPKPKSRASVKFMSKADWESNAAKAGVSVTTLRRRVKEARLDGLKVVKPSGS